MSEDYTPTQALERDLRDARRLIAAQQALLRAHHMAGGPRVLPGHGNYQPCMNPARYGTDCGTCMRCCSIYTGGALRWDPATTVVGNPDDPVDQHHSIRAVRL
jgi:hypothetical protein